MRDINNFSQTVHYVSFANFISSVNRTPLKSYEKHHSRP